VIKKALGDPSYSTSDHGYPPGLEIKVLTDRHHASIEKAAAIIGIGRNNVVNLSAASGMDGDGFAPVLKRTLEGYKKSGKRVASIVVISHAEVNTVGYVVSYCYS
jgi:hypothetical protein